MNHYVDRDKLKAALSIPGSATDKHDLLDAAVEGVCREIDQYVGAAFYPASGTRHYRARSSARLDLDYPLLAVDAIALDTDGDATYESTLATSAYWPLPDNATAASPPQPWHGLELRDGATAAFPVGVARGVKITGTWGWYDQRSETTAKPATGVNATATVWDFVGASNVHPGQTLRVDSEQVFVVDNALSGSATAATSGQITVQRGVNGTSGATHSSNSTVSIYEYPVIERAALYQAEMDFRAQDAPLGVVGGDLGGGQPVRAPGGLHPFVRRMLDLYRPPVAL